MKNILVLLLSFILTISSFAQKKIISHRSETWSWIDTNWIQSSVKLKEEEFERSVNEALKSTANKLEKIAYSNKISKKIKLRKQGVKITKPALKTVANPSGKDVQVRIFEELSTDSCGVVTSKMSQKEFIGDSINSKNHFTPYESIEKTQDRVSQAKNFENLRHELMQNKNEIVKLFRSAVWQFKMLKVLALSSLLAVQGHDNGSHECIHKKVLGL
jgi:hypothetical protein